MARTTEAAVKELLQHDYDLRNNPSLLIHIRTANSVTTRAMACMARKGITLIDTDALTMETWLAGYYYTQTNPVYSSKSTDGRSASFLREGGVNPYKLGALALDQGGCLAGILDQQKAVKPGFSWLGKTESEAIPYDQRD